MSTRHLHDYPDTTPRPSDIDIRRFVERPKHSTTKQPDRRARAEGGAA